MRLAILPKNMFQKSVENIARCILATLSIALARCTTTSIAPEALSQDLIRLSSLNDHRLYLHVKNIQESEIVGHQYLLVVLPFGRVRSPSLTHFVFNTAFKDLTLAGERIIPASLPLSKSALPLIEISIDDASDSAYDLRALRRVEASVTLTITLWLTPDIPAWRKTLLGHYSGYTKSPFSKELSNAFEKAIEDALSPLHDKIALLPR